jgi:hypothetical protein
MIFNALLAEVSHTGPPVDLSAMTRADHPKPTATSPKASTQPTANTKTADTAPVAVPARKTYEEYVEECNRKIAAAPRNYGGASGPSAFLNPSTTSMPAKYARPKPKTSKQVRDAMAAAQAKEDKEEADDLSDAIEFELFGTGNKKRSYEEVEITADTDLTKIGVFLGREEKKTKAKNSAPQNIKLNTAAGGEVPRAKLPAPRKKVRLGASEVRFSDEEQGHAVKATTKKGKKTAASKVGKKSGK